MASDPEAIVNLIASILRPVRAHREASRLEEATQPELRALTQLILEHAVGLRLAVQVRDEDRAAGHLDGLRRLCNKKVPDDNSRGL